jgi:hypothetical protein
LALAAALAWFAIAVLAQADDHKTYVGSEVCGECHEEEYASFTAHSRKSHSFESVAVLKKGLTEAEYRGCLACHATGYGEPGGFRSESETPHLKNAGCESCHGPGSLHADSGDPDDIRGELSVEDCTRCHNAERVGAFKFKPLLFGGAH